MMEKKKEEISLLDIFLILLKINTVTFGGGYTIMPVIKSEFSEKRNLLTETEMLDILAIAQSGPGALAINTSILTGYKLRGPKGGIIATIAGILPSLTIITIIYYFYEAFSQNLIVRYALRMMSGVISAILLHSVFSLAKTALKEDFAISLLALIIAFILSFIIDVNTALIILLLGLSGIIIYTWKEKEEEK